MKTIDYSDFYKFIVSVGVIILSFSVIFPWLLLREPFDIALKSSEIAQLSVVGQSIVAMRQNTTFWFLSNAKCISFVFVFFGLSFMFCGLKGWYRIQKLRDKREEYKTEDKKLKLQQLTEGQMQKKNNLDVFEGTDTGVREDVENQSEVNLTPYTSPDDNQYLSVEKKVQERLRLAFDQYGEIITNRRINSAEYDAILRSGNEEAADIIFEVKYAKNGFKINWVRETVKRLVLSGEIYKSNQKRPIICVAIFISASTVTPNIPTDIYKIKVLEEMKMLGSDPRIIFLAEKDIESLDKEYLYSIVFNE